MKPPENVDNLIGAEATTLPVASPKSVRRHARTLIAGHRNGFLAVALLNGVAALAALVGPRVLGEVVEGVRDSNITTSRIDQLALFFLVAVAVQTVFTRWARMRGAILGEWILADLREDFLTRAVGLPLGAVERAGTGDLVTRATTDVDRLVVGRAAGRTRDDHRGGHRGPRADGPRADRPGARHRLACGGAADPHREPVVLQARTQGLLRRAGRLRRGQCRRRGDGGLRSYGRGVPARTGARASGGRAHPALDLLGDLHAEPAVGVVPERRGGVRACRSRPCCSPEASCTSTAMRRWPRSRLRFSTRRCSWSPWTCCSCGSTSCRPDRHRSRGCSASTRFRTPTSTAAASRRPTRSRHGTCASRIAGTATCCTVSTSTWHQVRASRSSGLRVPASPPSVGCSPGSTARGPAT